MSQSHIVEIVRQRLADGRHVSETDVSALLAEIDRLNKIIDDHADAINRTHARVKA
jgi:hypothetical protein